MKYYSVKFVFNIPVAVNDDADEIDAYYEARDRFSEYNANEADVSIDTITEAKYNSDSATENALHRDRDQ